MMVTKATYNHNWGTLVALALPNQSKALTLKSPLLQPHF